MSRRGHMAGLSLRYARVRGGAAGPELLAQARSLHANLDPSRGVAAAPVVPRTGPGQGSLRIR
jgi:hypothetical protein